MGLASAGGHISRAPPVGASHIAGVYYAGSHSGGGSVVFKVSADETRVSAFTILNDVPGPATCNVGTISGQEGVFLGIPITDHAFTYRTSSVRWSGSFPAPGSAEGTLSFHDQIIIPGLPPLVCDSSIFTWTAVAPVPLPSNTPTPTATPGGSTPTPSNSPTPTPNEPTPTPTAPPGGPTPTPSTSASPTPVPTGSPAGLTQDNVDCNGGVDAVDALKDLRYVAGISYSQDEPCPDIGTEVASKFGDVDCDEDIDAVDALRILRFVAGLPPLSTPPSCPPIGSFVTSLAAAASAGNAELAVASTTGFNVGDRIRINPGGANEEDNEIAGFGSVLLSSPLEFDHAAGELVIEISGSPSPAPTPTPTPAPGLGFGDGTWIVGAEVSPGTWRNSDSSGGCYWARLRGFSGELDDIIVNNFSDSIQTVTINPTDAGFSSERCGTWSQIFTHHRQDLTSPSALERGSWELRLAREPGATATHLAGATGRVSEVSAESLTTS